MISGWKQGSPSIPPPLSPFSTKSFDDLDFVLVMSVNPGFGGQAFIKSSLGKIRRLREIVPARSFWTSRWMVESTPNTAGPLAAAGASTLIAGSAVFGKPDRGHALSALRAAAQQGYDS